MTADASTNTYAESNSCSEPICRRAFLIGDNLPLQVSLAEQLGLHVQSQAWLTWTDAGLQSALRNHRRNPRLDPDLVWIHWGAETMRLSGALQRDLRNKLARIVKVQMKNGASVIVEAEAGHWPSLRSIATASIFTCALGLPHCSHYTAMATAGGKSLPCLCGLLGGNKPETIAQQHKCYLAVCKWLINGQNMYMTRAGDTIPPYPDSHGTPAENPSRSKSVSFHESPDTVEIAISDRQEAAEAGGRSPPNSKQESFPTEQAIRQKEARKAKAEKLVASGLSPEEVKKLLIRKKKFQ